ncbi:hypothetical protein [Nocardioides marmoriginsengisoli]|uniref:hypothetical protein n=1 Tax=Nocardioides marmoriginsengisoli TaxID=661483 RepID=UPI0011CECFC7|nr:hypothetical protein [Nocardioides marmoriginsengisoli]
MNAALPAWFALIVQVPTPVKETVDPLSEQTADEPPSTASATGSPEVAVAVTAYVGPWYVAAPGAVEVKVIAWSVLVTPKDCWTWAAAR